MNRLNLGTLIGAFAKIRPRLEATAHARTGCRATAEDLTQDAWLKLENARLDAAIENADGFITRVANNAVSDHVRKERRRAEIDGEVAELLWETVDDVSPERALLSRERLAAVEKALAELPAKTRRIFLMNRLEGVSHRRIAEAFEMTDEAVYYHIRRALERLAEFRDDKGL